MNGYPPTQVGISIHSLKRNWCVQVSIIFLGESFKIPECHEYNPNLDPSLSTDFTMTSFRGFHIFIPPTIHFTDKNGHTTELNISDTFHKVDILRTQFDNLVRGLSDQTLRLRNSEQKLGYDDEVRNTFSVYCCFYLSMISFLGPK